MSRYSCPICRGIWPTKKARCPQMPLTDIALPISLWHATSITFRIGSPYRAAIYGRKPTKGSPSRIRRENAGSLSAACAGAFTSERLSNFANGMLESRRPSSYR
jgi:hypothetical protein